MRRKHKRQLNSDELIDEFEWRRSILAGITGIQIFSTVVLVFLQTSWFPFVFMPLAILNIWLHWTLWRCPSCEYRFLGFGGVGVYPFFCPEPFYCPHCKSQLHISNNPDRQIVSKDTVNTKNVVKDFVRLRRKVVVINLIVIAPFLVLILFGSNLKYDDVRYMFGFYLVLAIPGYLILAWLYWVYWKCPSCNKNFGGAKGLEINPFFCSKPLNCPYCKSKLL